jgi:hypothetical protein
MTDVACFLLAGAEKMVTVFRRISTRSTIQFRIGFHDSTSSTAPVDGAYLQYDGATGLMSAICRSNNTQTVAGSTFALAANTWYTCIIEANANATSINFKIYSEAGILLWQENVATNIPTAAGRETGAGVIATESTNDAAADILDLDYLRIEINRTLTR